MKAQAYNLFSQGKISEAQDICEKLCSNTPGDAQVWHLQGLIFAKCEKFEESERALLTALDLEKTTHTMLTLGQLYLYTNRIEEAEESFLNTLSMDTTLVDAHTGLASVYGLTDRLELAIEQYQQVIKLNAANADTYGNLATLYFRIRDEHKAKECALSSLKMDANNVSSNILLSKIERRDGEYSASIHRLKNLLKIYNHPSVVVSVATELGLALDKDCQFTEAYKAFENANKATQQIIATRKYPKDVYLNKIKSYMDWFIPDNIVTRGKVSSSDLITEPVFYVGFPRSGTTLIEQILTANPNIEATGELPLITELIDYTKTTFSGKGEFPALIGNLNDEELQSLQSIYVDKLYSSISNDVGDISIIDKLPLNLIEVGFINFLFPDAKIIMAYRDPRDVCLSCFMQNFKLNAGMIHFNTLEDAANLYARSMDLWLQYKEHLKLDLYEYKYEDLIEDPEKITGEMVDFIGEELTPGMNEYYVHASSKKVKTPSYIDVTEPIYTRSVSRWKNYEKNMEDVMGILQPYVNLFGYK